jgi:UDP-N-acetylmuramoyl-tripeptide--D-alanyl-D-alanine ligase
LREVVTYGGSAHCDLQLTARGAEGEGWFLEVNGNRRFGLGLPGRHNALNALAAIAIGRRLGVSDEAIGRALAAAQPVQMRMARCAVAGMTVYNDAYNANPDSVMAALETFAELAAGATRRVVILGDMRELGPETETLHRQVGRYLVEMKDRGAPDLVVLVGESARACAEPRRQAWDSARYTVLADDEVFPQAVAACLQPGDAVLLKASRALALERVIDELASV